MLASSVAMDLDFQAQPVSNIPCLYSLLPSQCLSALSPASSNSSISSRTYFLRSSQIRLLLRPSWKTCHGFHVWKYKFPAPKLGLELYVAKLSSLTSHHLFFMRASLQFCSTLLGMLWVSLTFRLAQVGPFSHSEYFWFIFASSIKILPSPSRYI